MQDKIALVVENYLGTVCEYGKQLKTAITAHHLKNIAEMEESAGKRVEGMDYQHLFEKLETAITSAEAKLHTIISNQKEAE